MQNIQQLVLVSLGIGLNVLLMSAQEILNNFKQPIDSDVYVVEDDASDAIVNAVSRLAFLVRKIRLSPKLRRLMQTVCEEKKVQYLVPIIDVSTRWNTTYDISVLIQH